jgi:hypothetical protein
VNREWVEDVARRLRDYMPVVRRRQEALLEAEWFASPVRVEITYYGRAYTTLRPTVTTIAVADSAYGGWAGAEMTLHEVSHALTGPLEGRLRREGAAQGKDVADLWHPVMFYLTGENWRAALAARGISYTPYMYANGLFNRNWRSLRTPIETHIKPFVEGRANAGAAYRGLIEALTPR